MKKLIFFLILFSLVLFEGFCETDLQSFLSSRHSNSVLPVDKTIGQTADEDNSEAHKALTQALGQEYSFDWLETYLAASFRETAANIWSERLSSLLPATEFVMSLGKANADSSVSISVRLLATDTVVHFALKDGLIEAIGF